MAQMKGLRTAIAETRRVSLEFFKKVYEMRNA